MATFISNNSELPTYRIGVEEPARGSDQPHEHVVVEVARRAHAQHEKGDGPRHGGHDQAGNDERVYSQVEVVLVKVHFFPTCDVPAKEKNDTK